MIVQYLFLNKDLKNRENSALKASMEFLRYYIIPNGTANTVEHYAPAYKRGTDEEQHYFVKELEEMAKRTRAEGKRYFYYNIVRDIDNNCRYEFLKDKCHIKSYDIRTFNMDYESYKWLFTRGETFINYYDGETLDALASRAKEQGFIELKDYWVSLAPTGIEYVSFRPMKEEKIGNFVEDVMKRWILTQ